MSNKVFCEHYTQGFLFINMNHVLYDVLLRVCFDAISFLRDAIMALFWKTSSLNFLADNLRPIFTS